MCGGGQQGRTLAAGWKRETWRSQRACFPALSALLTLQAAQAAGWEAVLVVREGNAPLPEGHGFRTVTSMTELV